MVTNTCFSIPFFTPSDFLWWPCTHHLLAFLDAIFDTFVFQVGPPTPFPMLTKRFDPESIVRSKSVNLQTEILKVLNLYSVNLQTEIVINYHIFHSDLPFLLCEINEARWSLALIIFSFFFSFSLIFFLGFGVSAGSCFYAGINYKSELKIKFGSKILPWNMLGGQDLWIPIQWLNFPVSRGFPNSINKVKGAIISVFQASRETQNLFVRNLNSRRVGGDEFGEISLIWRLICTGHYQYISSYQQSRTPFNCFTSPPSKLYLATIKVWSNPCSPDRNSMRERLKQLKIRISFWFANSRLSQKAFMI